MPRYSLCVPIVLVCLFSVGIEPSWARPQEQGFVNRTKTRVKKAWSRVRGKPLEIKKVRLNHRAIGDWSTFASIASNATQVIRSSAVLSQAALPLGVLSSGGMIVGGGIKFTTAENDRQRSDATHLMLWGVQDGVRVGSVAAAHLTEKGLIHTIGQVAGAIGGGIQTGVGVYEITSGVKDLRAKEPKRSPKKNKERVVLGVIDTCAGACWTASSVGVFTPVTLTAFLSLAGTRVVYTNREKFKQFGKDVRHLLKRGKWPKKQPRRDGKGQGRPAATIVTPPVSREVGEKAANGPGTRMVITPQGDPAVVSPAKIITTEGKSKPAEVVSPIDLTK